MRVCPCVYVQVCECVCDLCLCMCVCSYMRARVQCASTHRALATRPHRAGVSVELDDLVLSVEGGPCQCAAGIVFLIRYTQSQVP